MEVSIGASGGLEVVGAVELPLDQPPPQPQPTGQIPPLGALVDPDGVEPWRPGQPIGEGRGGQQGDIRACVVATDRGERAKRQDNVAEGAELHHQYAVGVRHHAGGWVAAQWGGMSMRRVIQTPANRLTWSSSRSRPPAREGWPMILMCRPMESMRGWVAPSRYRKSNASRQ